MYKYLPLKHDNRNVIECIRSNRKIVSETLRFQLIGQLQLISGICYGTQKSSQFPFPESK